MKVRSVTVTEAVPPRQIKARKPSRMALERNMLVDLFHNTVVEGHEIMAVDLEEGDKPLTFRNRLRNIGEHFDIPYVGRTKDESLPLEHQLFMRTRDRTIFVGRWSDVKSAIDEVEAEAETDSNQDLVAVGAPETATAEAPKPKRRKNGE